MKKGSVSLAVLKGFSAFAFLFPAAPELRAAAPESGQKKAPAKAPGNSGDDPDRPELTAAREKFRKVVERTLGPRESKFYVVSISKTSYHETRIRWFDAPAGNPVKRLFVREIPPRGTYLPVETVEFHIQEGRQPCIDLIVDQMTPFLASQLQSAKNEPDDQRPASTGKWKLLGRFDTAEKAQGAVKKAEAVLNAGPRWEAEEKKPGDGN